MELNINNNRYIGGYYIFIKVGDDIVTDDELLELLDFKKIESKKSREQCYKANRGKLCITERESWKHLMDYDYSHFLSRQVVFKKRNNTKDIIAEFVKKYDLFEAYVSDVDNTFSYKYFEQGELKRHHSVSPLNGSYVETYIDCDLGEKKMAKLKS